MADTSKALIPLPNLSEQLVESDSMRIATNFVTQNTDPNSLYTKDSVVAVGARLYALAYKNAFSDSYQYVVNSAINLLQSSNEVYERALMYLDAQNKQTMQSFNTGLQSYNVGIQTFTTGVTQSMNAFADRITSVYKEQVELVKQLKDEMIAQLRSELDGWRSEAVAARKTIDSLQERITMCESRRADKTIDIATGIGRAQGRSELAEQLLFVERKKTDDLSQQVSRLQGELETTRNEKSRSIAELKSQLENVVSSYNQLYTNSVTLQSAYNQQVQIIEKAKIKVEDLRRERNEIKSKYEELKKEKGEVDVGGLTQDMSVNRNKYVHIPSRILESPIKVDMTEEFFKRNWYLGCETKHNRHIVIVYYTPTGEKKVMHVDGSDYRTDNVKIMENSNIVIFDSTIKKED